MYGATGGILFAYGTAGDRFAVRNSGATAVIEGAGLHLCEYMTRGVVVALGEVSHNIGAGMTGGTLYLMDDYEDRLNRESVSPAPLRPQDEEQLLDILNRYSEATGSQRVQWLLSEWRVFRRRFLRVVPHRTAQHEFREAMAADEAETANGLLTPTAGSALGT